MKNNNLNAFNSSELLKFIVLKLLKVNNPNINAFNFSSHLSKNFFISGLLSNLFLKASKCFSSKKLTKKLLQT